MVIFNSYVKLPECMFDDYWRVDFWADRPPSRKPREWDPYSYSWPQSYGRCMGNIWERKVPSLGIPANSLTSQVELAQARCTCLDSLQLTVGKNYPPLKYKSQLRCSIRGSILEWCLRSLISLNILEECSEDSSLQTHLFATFHVGIYIPTTSITLIYNPNHD